MEDTRQDLLADGVGPPAEQRPVVELGGGRVADCGVGVLLDDVGLAGVSAAASQSGSQSLATNWALGFQRSHVCSHD